MNSINIIGRLTRDVEISYTKSNKAIGKFSIAVPNSYNKEEVYFFNCTVWDKQATILAQYVKKGNQIALIGELKQNRWQDKEGKNRSAVDINVNSFTFIGGSNEKTNDSAGGNGNNQDGEKFNPGKPDIQFEDLNENDPDDTPF